MTDVSATPLKLERRAFLFKVALEALEAQGWAVERIARLGKSSVRRITKGKESKTVSIRTSQDTWIAFPRNNEDNGWATLADVDYVVAASVDDHEKPRFANVHLITGDEMRARFDRAYAARKSAGYTMHKGRGVWLSLYEEDGKQPVTLVGAGAGLKHKPIASIPLSDSDSDQTEVNGLVTELDGQDVELEEAPLTISEAKRRLALTLGVDETAITITIST
jgi:hypothetical protein